MSTAETKQSQAIYVIFRESFGFEDAVRARPGQFVQSGAAISRADPGARKKTAEQRPNRHVARMVFGEFVAVDAVGESGEGRRQGEYGSLDEVVTRRVEIDPMQFVGMNQVLRIVGDDDVELPTVLLFIKQQMLVDPVEAIRLGRRTFM